MQHIINNFLQKKSQIKPKYFTEFTTKCHKNRFNLSSLPPYPASQLDVFGHDGDSLGVDGTQIGIFKQPHQVCFASLLKGTDGCTLKPQVGFEILGDLPHQSLEWQLPDEQLSRFLVTTDLSQSHGPWPVAVRLLHPAGRGRAFPSRLGGQLFAGGFPTGGLPSGLLGSGHFFSPKAESPATALEAPTEVEPGTETQQWKQQHQHCQQIYTQWVGKEPTSSPAPVFRTLESSDPAGPRLHQAHNTRFAQQSQSTHQETWRSGEEEPAPARELGTRTEVFKAATGTAAGASGDGADTNGQHWINHLFRSLGFRARGDWSGCGKHRVLPWRSRQCQYHQHQWPWRPQQPAECREWRGLFQCQCQTLLRVLGPSMA